MAVKSEEDKAVKQKDVDLKKGDSPLNHKNNELDKFEIDPKKAPHNKSVDGKPLDTNKDKYNEATRVGEDEGQEAIKTAREKFAKKKDEPAGIAAAKVGAESIPKSLEETDPQKISQVIPQMYSQFAMVSNILKSSGSGQQGQTAQQIQAGQPDFYQDIDTHTKDLLISAVTHGLAILTRNFGYKKVLTNIQKATTGYYTKKELDAINWFDPNFDSNTFRFDRLSADYQDVMATSVTVLGKLYEKYGEKNIPFITPFYKPKTKKKPPKIVTIPTKYSTLKFYPTYGYNTVTFNGNTDIGSNGFVKVVNNTLVNDDIVIYTPDVGNNVIKGLSANSYYYIARANTSGFQLVKTPNGAPVISRSAPSSVTTNQIILSSPPIIVNGVNITAIIVDRYKKFLRRLPDQEGLYATEAAMKGWLQTLPLANAISKLDSLLRSSEEYAALNAQGNTDENDTVNSVPVIYVGADGVTRNLTLIVKDKYKAIAKRSNPDTAGLAFWINTLKGLLDTHTFIDAMAKFDKSFREAVMQVVSPETSNLKPWTTPPKFYTDTAGNNYNLSEIIRDKYKTFAKREPDQDGMTFWEKTLKLYIDQYGFQNASLKLSKDFREIVKVQEEAKAAFFGNTASNTNVKPIVNANTTPAKIANTPGSNAVLYIVEEYPGYARWDGIDGTIQYQERTQYLPDFDNADLLTVYLSAYSFAADLFSVIPKESLDFNLLNILLDRYARKIENDYSDFVLGYGVWQDRQANAQDFNANPESGGSGKSSSMLSQLLPQLKQLLQNTQQKHLPQSVLDQEPIRKLLENFEQRKTENKKMANLIDDGFGKDGIPGIGQLFQGGGMENLLGQLSALKGGGSGTGTNNGSINNNATGGITSSSGNISPTGKGTVNLTTTVGGTTDSSAIVRTFNTVAPATILSTVAPPPSTPINVGGNTVDLKQVVRDKYLTFAKREPDSEGWQFWINSYLTLLKTMSFQQATAEINKGFKIAVARTQVNPDTGEPYKDAVPIQILDPVKTPDVIYKGYNISAMIKDKYKTFVGRDAEQAGLTFWENFVKNRMDQVGYENAVLELNKEFQKTPEYKKKQAAARVNSKKVAVPQIKTDDLIGFDF